jgi:hypothetical protein
MISIKLRELWKQFWWTILLPIIVVPLIWNYAKPKDLWGEFNVVDLRIPSDFNFKSTQYEDIQLINVKINNKREEDIYLKYLEVNFIKNFKGINFKFPSTYKAPDNKLPYEILNTEGNLKINGNIPIPASDSVNIYIWATGISKFPDIICNTNKGKIDIEGQIGVDNKIKYLIYDNVYIILIICIVILVFFCVRFEKKE